MRVSICLSHESHLEDWKITSRKLIYYVLVFERILKRNKKTFLRAMSVRVVARLPQNTKKQNKKLKFFFALRAPLGPLLYGKICTAFLHPRGQYSELKLQNYFSFLFYSALKMRKYSAISPRAPN